MDGAGWVGRGGTGGKIEHTYAMGSPPTPPMQFISYAFHASCGTKLSALEHPVLAQQSSLVGLGRAELTCTLEQHPMMT